VAAPIRLKPVNLTFWCRRPEATIQKIKRAGFSKARLLFCNAVRFFPLEGGESKLVQPNEREKKQPTIENQNPNMKTISLIAAILLTVALAGSAVGQERATSQDTIVAASHGHQNQFNGTLTGAENFRLLGDPPFLFYVDGAGTANTTLGQFTWVYTHMVAFSDINPLTTPGRARFIAANGDNIFSSADSVSIPTADPNVSNIIERHTITGGTGRFEGARGNFTINRVITVENQEVLNGTTTGSFHGTIILKKHHH
jgi:hypothetical protein